MDADLTLMLQAAREGDMAAEARLLEAIYPVLKDRAARALKHMPSGETLNPTALVNEAYMVLFRGGAKDWQNRGHFFAYAAKAMRHLIVQRVRRQKAEKRGAGEPSFPLLEMDLAVPANLDLQALDEALDRLETLDLRKARIVEMRFFAGLAMSEIAAYFEVSEMTVHNELRKAKGWLFRVLSGGGS